jgi:OOP family OmpA-OmpF porin
MRLRQALLVVLMLGAPVAALLLWPLAAAAQPFQGVYLGIGAGYHETSNAGAASPSFPGGNGLELRENGGFAGVVNLGYGLGNGWRVEIEGSGRSNAVGHLSSGSIATAAGGNIQTYAVMANVLFDLDVGSPWIYPYLGGGLGYGWSSLDGVRADAAIPSFSFRSSDSAGSAAYQAMAGVSFPMPGVPGLSLTAEYRLFGSPFTRTFQGTTNGAETSMRLGPLFDQAALFGVRFAFGVRPPSPEK